ncbi:TMAO/DMSO reductase [Nocardioides dokdonensis FR1436]|uniref:TMAO/DMSO reductase n=1 Tax=Nocardioides dokdonensis FR1436 TaxID=1300347 RepID=A0A1A9GMN7_9ACTN|nr:molybdopterin-dependent oxidoreductase [Nocardioides dokdonensis]ANH39336.1 TMAO/DMSO reductase [Nocardioides dokdonensis FR1436]
MSASLRLPDERSFSTRLRSAAVAARVGTVLGVCFALAFLTGLVSHYAQNPTQPVPFPTSPAWGYRLTQGLHIISGTAAVPLLLVKLWTVYPLLLARPSLRLRRLAVELAERLSILLLVGAALFLLVTGLQNISHWYPWAFSFRSTHYAMAWIAIGSLVLHVAVKLPLVRHALTHDVDDTTLDRPGAAEPGAAEPGAAEPAAAGPGALGRRGLLRATWLATGAVVLATAGSTVPFLRWVSVLAVRSGEGPQGVPVNKTAEDAGVTEAAQDPAYRLEVVHGERSVSLDRDDLLALPQRSEELPIACVEGWSASGTWSGVRLRDLLDLVEAPQDVEVVLTSLQESGPFRVTLLQSGFVDDDRTLVALGLAGSPLDLDHGYPARLIAPNRPGVLQTKWLSRIEVRT